MRKPIIYYGLGVLVILVLWLGIRYLTTGRIVITTSSNATSMTLFKLNEVSGQKPVATSSAKVLDARLGAGDYVVKVNSKSFATTKVVTVKARKTSRYTLNPAGLSALEPVSPSGAYSIAASSSSLLYVDPASKTLYEVDSQNNIQPVDTTHKFDSIKWVDTSYGVGKATDGQLYSISNGLIQPIKLPFSTAGSKAMSYTVSTTKQIFVSDGTDVYAGTDAGVFTKIHTTTSPTPSLFAWGDKVAILVVPGDTTNTSLAASVTIVDKGGQVLAKKAFDADSAAWSEDGKYLALFSDATSGEVVSSSLGVVASLPSIAVDSLVWAGNTLYYTVNEQLWSYDIKGGISQLVASMPTGNSLSNAALSSDKSYIYLTVSSGDNLKTYRYSLRGQDVASYVYQLPIILPDSSQPCLLSYINFTSPTILGYGASNPNQTCAAAVSEVFAPYNVDTSFLHTRFVQVSSGD